MNISLNNAALWNVACAYQTILWIQEGVLPEKVLDEKSGKYIDLYDLPRKIILPDPYGEYIMEMIDGKPLMVKKEDIFEYDLDKKKIKPKKRQK